MTKYTDHPFTRNGIGCPLCGGDKERGEGGLSKTAIRALGFDAMCKCGHEEGLHDIDGKFCQALACGCECFEQVKK
ncbi:MAG TPA: hypothetical protein VLL28_08955 [Hyphomicrobiaceae bacterium]|nr:hypothetical protein [Hyphomicrobiaceae bacterium]